MLEERIWSLHCNGERVGDIAAKLNEPPDSVRYSITKHWRADKEEASENRKPGSGKGRRW